MDDFKGGGRTSAGRNVPYSVFLAPPLSRVGLTEKAALAEGYKIKTAVIPVTEAAAVTRPRQVYGDAEGRRRRR